MTEEGLLTDLNRECGLIKVCSYNKLKTYKFVMHILEEHSNDVPCYATKCKLILCIPVTSVECEHTLSKQNRIKTKLQNRLDNDCVNTLMKLNMGPQLKYLTLLRQCATGRQQNKGICCWFALSVKTTYHQHCFVFMVEIKMLKKSNTAQMPHLKKAKAVASCIRYNNA